MVQVVSLVIERLALLRLSVEQCYVLGLVFAKGAYLVVSEGLVCLFALVITHNQPQC